jgi:hypothetical protein
MPVHNVSETTFVHTIGRLGGQPWIWLFSSLRLEASSEVILLSGIES